MRTKRKILRAPIVDELYLMRICLASAGPNPSVIGMRKIWGKDACIIRCGQYIYHVKEEDYSYYKEWG